MMSDPTNCKLKKVFCFGVFDGIHEGHIHMLKAAKALGDYLIVAVTQDTVVAALKNRKTRANVHERIAALEKLGIADEVVGGDMAIKTWQVLQNYKPSTIALGYDQGRLKEALEEAKKNFSFPTEVVVLQPHRPDELHSSLLFDKP